MCVRVCGERPRWVLLSREVESKLVIVYLTISVLITPSEPEVTHTQQIMFQNIAIHILHTYFMCVLCSLFHEVLQLCVSDLDLHVSTDCTHITGTDTTTPTKQ